MLLEKAIRFCEVRNVVKVEIELPQEEHNIISIFLKFDFKIAAIRERYTPSKSVCILEKALGDIYFGDPFDDIEIATWLLNQYIPCKINKHKTVESFIRIPFECNTHSKAFSVENKVGYSKRLSGDMWVIYHNPDRAIDKDISTVISKSKDSTIKLLKTPILQDYQKQKLLNNNFVFFDYNETKAIAGGVNSSLNVPFDIEKIGGVLTVLEYEEIISYSKKSSLTYYLFSGISEGLSLDGNGRILAVYCPYWLSNTPGIIGYFEIEELSKKTFEKLLLEDVPEDSALSKEDLRLYKLYSEKEQIAILTCSEFVLFDRPFPIVDGQWVSNKKVEKYLNYEIYENGSNSTYLDTTSCNNLRKLKKENLETSKNTDMILTSIATALGLIADSIAIKDFTQKQIENLRARLIKDDKSTEEALQSNGGIFTNVIDAHVRQLGEFTNNYTKVLESKSYMQPEKDLTCRTIASKVVDLLNLLKSVKNHIKDYDLLHSLFTDIASA